MVEVSGRLCVSVPVSSLNDQGGASGRGLVLGSSAGSVFLEPPACVQLNNQLQQVRAEAQAAEDAVLWKVTAAVLEAYQELRQGLEFVVWLDCAVARARFSEWMDGKRRATGRTSRTSQIRPPTQLVLQTGRPEFVDFPAGGSRTRRQQQAVEAEAQFVALRRLRHPLLQARHLRWKAEQSRLERQVHFQPGFGAAAKTRAPIPPTCRVRSGETASAAPVGGNFMHKPAAARQEGEAAAAAAAQDPASKPPVAIDVSVPVGVRAVLITGPNTGGKTAALKALALAVLMSKSGLYVPCGGSACRLPWFSQVLADIGDEQSLSASLSTFSGHLKRIQQLRAESDSRALVLLDEIGTGTDPVEGAALGTALLQRLVQGGPGGAGLVVGTTHMGSLTSLKYNDPRFENASVEFDEQASGADAAPSSFALS